MSKKWTKIEEDFLIKNYASMPLEEICNTIKRTRYSVIDRAVKKLKLQRNYELAYAETSRKYTFNQDYFRNIDSQEKAYWYGFIWADGSITKNRLTIVLAEKDKEILEQLNKVIFGNYPIRYVKKHKAYSIHICSYKTAKNLNSLNILPNKTYLDKTPIISDDLFIAFLLGLFDGDGCFCKRFSITNTKYTCLFIQKKLKELFDIDSRVYKRKNTHAYQINVMKKKHFILLYKLLYNTHIFFLERKRKKYINFLSKTKDWLQNCDGLKPEPVLIS